MNAVDTALHQMLNLSGIIGAALVDSQTGVILAQATPSTPQTFNLEAAAATNASITRSKLEAMKQMNISDDEIEDVVITLGKQYHLVRLIPKTNGVFLYCALERSLADLALAKELMRGVSHTVSTQRINL